MNSLIVNDKNITNMIYEIRGKQVMLDSDLAILYECKNGTKEINQAVKNNKDRFPENFCFQLTLEEYDILRSKFLTLKKGRGAHRKYLPYVFTEQGVAMLSGIIKSEIAVNISIAIMNVFVLMRKYISNELIEQKYINNLVIKHDEDIKLLQESFDKFEEKRKSNEIYFNGQIYDSYSKILDILKEAKKDLIIIDNYADKNMLDMIRNINVNTTIICKENCLLKEIDINKYNEQYNNLKVIYNNTFHDRYIIIDKKVIYHCGTSLNHIGSKTFSVNKLEDKEVIEALLKKIKTC